jgi:hypothetical protein
MDTEGAAVRSACDRIVGMGPEDMRNEFADGVSDGILAAQDKRTWSRERVYTLPKTFWGFVWQAMHGKASCREVVRCIQLMATVPVRRLCGSTSAYCQARAKIPETVMREAMEGSAASADRAAPEGEGTINGRKVKAVDASCVQIPDTDANRSVYPYPSGVKLGCGFPVMGFIALFSLVSGSVLKIITARATTHDYRLFRLLWESLEHGDIVLGDRAFCAYEALATLPAQGIDLICRLHQSRALYSKPMRQISKDEWIATWQKTKPHAKSPMTKEQHAALPDFIQVRILFLNLERHGFRTQKIWIVTTLLDHRLYPAEKLAELYLRRWGIELCFRDIKTTMRMEQLRCLTPAMARKELFAFLTAHNLVRLVIARAAARHGRPVSRISFKGCVDTLCAFLSGGCNGTAIQNTDALLEIVANDLVPLRPGRSEPRALKRRPKNYQLLTKHRHIFKEIPHRNAHKKKTERSLT